MEEKSNDFYSTNRDPIGKQIWYVTDILSLIGLIVKLTNITFQMRKQDHNSYVTLKENYQPNLLQTNQALWVLMSVKVLPRLYNIFQL